MRVLVVESEAAFADMLRQSLVEHGVCVDVAPCGDEGLCKLTSTAFDAVTLDILLPDIDGWDLIRQARARQIQVPMLVLTSLGRIEDRVRALNAGADDYLVRPVAVPELYARLVALTRRPCRPPQSVLRAGGISVDVGARRVVSDGCPIALTRREFTILEYLLVARGRVVTRRKLTAYLCDADLSVTAGSLDVSISSLRRKLGANLIRTERGEGYIVEG